MIEKTKNEYLRLRPIIYRERDIEKYITYATTSIYIEEIDEVKYYHSILCECTDKDTITESPGYFNVPTLSRNKEDALGLMKSKFVNTKGVLPEEAEVMTIKDYMDDKNLLVYKLKGIITREFIIMDDIWLYHGA